MSGRIIVGDCLDVLRSLDAGIAQTCVTSPPYFGLRDYGVAGQIGLEPSPSEYIAKLVDVFREVRRVLRDDGTLWLNIGDSYATTPVGSFNGGGFKDGSAQRGSRDLSGVETSGAVNKLKASGLKSKDLIGIPWMLAFALRTDGWYLRSDIIWAKRQCMPESVTDRPTKAHEYLFLLTKQPSYYYDATAIMEPVAEATRTDRPNDGERIDRGYPGALHNGNGRLGSGEKRNKRTVWTVASQPFAGAHFATFPPKLIEPCILAGSRPGDVVLDPFGGAGTTGLVADRLGRDYLLVELNPAYAEMARERIRREAGLFAGDVA